MVRLIIRDDDCNFFTHPEDLDKVYSSIPDFPVSFAVVPSVIDVCGGCPETKSNVDPKRIGENSALVNYLKDRFKAGRCDLLLHGITHGYKFNPDGSKIPEMIWRDGEKDLRETIRINKEYLESLFDISIKCFVAPSNHILRNGVRAVYENGLDYSGIIPLSFQRDFSIWSVSNYIKRLWVRATKMLPYPGILDYKTHRELNACNTITFDYLKRMFEYCQLIDSPMAINVHYWHIRDYPNHYKGFFEFVRYAMEKGAQPSRMRDCL